MTRTITITERELDLLWILAEARAIDLRKEIANTPGALSMESAQEIETIERLRDKLALLPETQA